MRRTAIILGAAFLTGQAGRCGGQDPRQMYTTAYERLLADGEVARYCADMGYPKGTCTVVVADSAASIQRVLFHEEILGRPGSALTTLEELLADDQRREAKFRPFALAPLVTSRQADGRALQVYFGPVIDGAIVAVVVGNVVPGRSYRAAMRAAAGLLTDWSRTVEYLFLFRPDGQIDRVVVKVFQG